MLSLILLALTSGVSTQPDPNSQWEAIESNACSEIARSYDLWTKNGGHGDFYDIPQQTAYDCLMSMPFDSQRAVKFIDEYLKYLQFQSTLDSLKHPPPGYITPSIDLLAGFSKIRDKAQQGVYNSHYSFDNDIKSLLQRANEGHLSLNLCSHKIFRFHRTPAVVSISTDGLSLPKIYTFHDASLIHAGFPADNLSHLVSINSASADYFLQAHLARTFELHDPDARWNHLFPWPVNQFTGLLTGGGWQSYEGLWPGAAQYILKFANETKLEVNTTASWPATNGLGPMTYTDGESLWKAACLPGHEPLLQSLSDTDAHPPSQHPDGPKPPGTQAPYPLPIIHTPNNSLRGYYLPPPHNDTAVLQIPTFRFTSGSKSNFSQTALEFLTRASHQDGKTKLIIDLQGNSGGDVIPGFNIFKILFPDLPIRTATRFRVTELVRLMVKVYSEAYGGVEDEKDVPSDPPFVAGVAVGADQKRIFMGWEQLLGPEGTKEGSMSSLLAHFDLNLASTLEEPVFGYGPFAWMRNGSRPFKAENIVVITNGQCASTCALLISLLRHLGLPSPSPSPGIRTLTFGGRPRLGPMQAVGGVKGGQYYSLSTIYKHVQRAIELAVTNSTLSPSSSKAALLTDEELARLKELAPVSLEDFPLRLGLNGLGAGVNFRDLYYLPVEHSDASKNGVKEMAAQVPAQFIYEPADCRRFITAEMLFRPAKMWEVAREVMWRMFDEDEKGEYGRCVGS
ncbi:hypothetical protein B0T20DRAFT_494683 [Sordaria brevicollis]|uniref:Tail specific protease domain-containing protein n=1 Tax=Sordaria brevicollis TaxID=83679 RepID=A0AAE0PIP7_SORBR|nr:hypothetical protein B0T20DRAFT_494683 [Sordaria brevicollis]